MDFPLQGDDDNRGNKISSTLTLDWGAIPIPPKKMI
jgi:hypothetical protein